MARLNVEWGSASDELIILTANDAKARAARTKKRKGKKKSEIKHLRKISILEFHFLV